jgi:phosphatidylinositol alpha-1,6-mannosyltransferase
MNVLLITHDYPPANPGGMSFGYRNLMAHWPRGDRVVLTPAHPDGPASERRDGVFVHRIPLKPLNPGPWYRTALRLAREHKTELILCGNASPFRYVADRLMKRDRLPYVLFFHGNDLMRLAARVRRSPWHRLSWSGTRRRLFALSVNTRHVAGLAERLLGVEPGRIIVSPPGVDDRLLGIDIEPPRFTPGEPVRLLTVGRLTPRKGVDRVIESLPLLVSRGHDVRYRVVGRGDPEPYRELARRLGVDDRVNFAGFVDERGLEEELRACDIFVMVSRVLDEGRDLEGFGIVYLEAGAFKRPVVAGATGGVPDAVLDGETGWLVGDPDSAGEIAQKIALVLRDPERARALAERAYERVNRSFTWEVRDAELYGELARRLK